MESNTPSVPDRRMAPLFEPEEYPAPTKATTLTVEPCAPEIACMMVRAYHSRLPNVQDGPWKLAFAAHYRSTVFGAALWHNPSARGLPQTWLELRRLVVAPDAPHCTASRMLGQMVRWIRRTLPEVDRLISYQDVEVHTGTIYRAAGWSPAYFSKPRLRDRSKPRIGTRRDYRSDLNGQAPAGAGKVRWELVLAGAPPGSSARAEGVAGQVHDPFSDAPRTSPEPRLHGWPPEGYPFRTRSGAPA